MSLIYTKFYARAASFVVVKSVRLGTCHPRYLRTFRTQAHFHTDSGILNRNSRSNIGPVSFFDRLCNLDVYQPLGLILITAFVYLNLTKTNALPEVRPCGDLASPLCLFLLI